MHFSFILRRRGKIFSWENIWSEKMFRWGKFFVRENLSRGKFFPANVLSLNPSSDLNILRSIFRSFSAIRIQKTAYSRNPSNPGDPPPPPHPPPPVMTENIFSNTLECHSDNITAILLFFSAQLSLLKHASFKLFLYLKIKCTSNVGSLWN